jgi:hypothetical protein
MRRLFISIFLAVLFFASKAQAVKNTSRYAVGIEAGKLGAVFHLIYDYRVKSLQWGMRANAGRNFGKYLDVFQTGAGAYYLLGKKNNHLEMGLDVNYFYADEISDDQRPGISLIPVRNASTIFTSGNLGYRHYGVRTVFRVGVSQGYIHSVKNYYTGAYLGFGFTF